MMPIDVNATAQSMLNAMLGILQQNYPNTQTHATSEAAKLAHSLAQIVELKVAGQINEGEAALLLEMQKNATRAVFLSIEGMGLLMAEQAINAALGVVRQAINTAIGFVLL
jgi:N-acetylmuramic acid 6-phosphate (MurNAc-6-P) etherase